ncbi:MAG: hypothetical protein DMG05_14035 [Acidobacteria bacterium]|nr:MAG: hypothetical protein DMG05_14035 [Acidobacteriota bacterium]
MKLKEVPTLVKFVTQIMHRTTPSTLKALASPAATPSPGLVNAYQAFTPLPMGDGLEFGRFSREFKRINGPCPSKNKGWKCQRSVCSITSRK